MISSQDNCNRLFRKQPAERVAVMENHWFDTLTAWLQQGYPMRTAHKEVGEYRWREDGKTEEVTEAGEYREPVPPWLHFGLDMTGAGGFKLEPILGYDELLEETDEWEVRRRGTGAAHKYWKHKSGTPEHIDFRMNSREVWERDYRPHLLTLNPERVALTTVRKQMAELATHGMWKWMGNIFIWEQARQSMGDVNLYQALLLDPEWMHDYGRVHTDLFKLHFAYLFEQAGLPDGIWISEDLGYKNGLFASPKVLNELIFPYYAELNAFFHTYGLPVVLHSCGSIAEAMPLIVGAGFDGLHAMENKAIHNDPLVFAEKYGDDLVFIGGLDARVFETNDQETIRREVTRYVQGMKARGARLVFGSDHSISPRVSYASYRYALDVYRENMWY